MWNGLRLTADSAQLQGAAKPERLGRHLKRDRDKGFSRPFTGNPSINRTINTLYQYIDIIDFIYKQIKVRQ
jgi:hypothetical protein